MNHKRVAAAGGVGGAAEEDCRSDRVPEAAARAAGITGGVQERQGDRKTTRAAGITGGAARAAGRQKKTTGAAGRRETELAIAVGRLEVDVVKNAGVGAGRRSG